VVLIRVTCVTVFAVVVCSRVTSGVSSGNDDNDEYFFPKVLKNTEVFKITLVTFVKVRAV